MMEPTHMGHKFMINNPKTKGKPTIISIDNDDRSRSKKETNGSNKVTKCNHLENKPLSR